MLLSRLELSRTMLCMKTMTCHHLHSRKRTNNCLDLCNYNTYYINSWLSSRPMNSSKIWPKSDWAYRGWFPKFATGLNVRPLVIWGAELYIYFNCFKSYDKNAKRSKKWKTHYTNNNFFTRLKKKTGKGNMYLHFVS